MIKNKKIILYAVTFLVVFYIVVTIVLNLPTGKKYKNTVFIGNYTKISVNNNKFDLYYKDEEAAKQKVKIYFKNKFVDGYIYSEKVDFDNEQYNFVVYNTYNEFLSPDGELLAYTNDLSIKVKETTESESKNLSDIEDFLDYEKIKYDSPVEVDYIRINSIDYDDDGTDEKIYSVGLRVGEEGTGNYYSYVYFKKNDNYIMIDQQKTDYNPDYKRLSFYKIIDFNDDDNYEFVIRKIMSEYGPNYYELYNFNGNEFTKIGGE